MNKDNRKIRKFILVFLSSFLCLNGIVYVVQKMLANFPETNALKWCDSESAIVEKLPLGYQSSQPIRNLIYINGEDYRCIFFENDKLPIDSDIYQRIRVKLSFSNFRCDYTKGNVAQMSIKVKEFWIIGNIQHCNLDYGEPYIIAFDEHQNLIAIKRSE